MYSLRTSSDAPRAHGEGELIELSDDEAVAAAVMLPMVAADRLAPSASSHTGGAFKRNARGIV